MNKNEQYELALALIDFTGGDLSTETAANYFRLHASHLSKEDRNKVLLTALSLV